MCGWWPILAADFTNDSKRSQASGANSSLRESAGFLGEDLGMVLPNKAISDLAPLIGKMTIDWNECQSSVFLMFNQMLGVGVYKAMAIFFAVKSDGGQRDITIALANNTLADPRLLKDFTAAMTAFNRIAGRRNDFIHAMWHTTPDSEDLKVWLDARARLVGKDPVVEIQALVDEIQALFLDLVVIGQRISEELTPPTSLLESLLPTPP